MDNNTLDYYKQLMAKWNNKEVSPYELTQEEKDKKSADMSGEQQVQPVNESPKLNELNQLKQQIFQSEQQVPDKQPIVEQDFTDYPAMSNTLRSVYNQKQAAYPDTGTPQPIVENKVIAPSIKQPIDAPKQEDSMEIVPTQTAPVQPVPISNEPDYEKMLAAAEDRAREERMVAGLGKAGAMINAALSGTKVDYSPYEDMAKGADLNIASVQNRQKLAESKLDREKKKLENQKTQEEFVKDQESKDPNHPLSSLYRNVLKEQGYPVSDKVSKYDIEKSPQLMTLINASENRKLRKQQSDDNKELQKLQFEELQLKRNTAANDKQDKELRSFDFKFVTSLNGVDEKYIATTKEVDTAKAMADLATKSPTAARNLARGMIKAIEGSGARVSDKDILTTMSAGGLSGEVVAWIKDRAEGTVPKFQQKDIANLLNVMEKIHKDKFSELKNNMFVRQLSVTKNLSNRNMDDLRMDYDPTWKPQQNNQNTDKQSSQQMVKMFNPRTGKSLMVPINEVEEAKSHGAEYSK